MSQVIKQNVLPSVMQEKLRSVRWRQAGLTAVRSIAIALSVLAVGMVVAMAIDWWFNLFSTTTRVVLTSVCLAASMTVLLITAVKPLIAALRWARAANNVDDRIPQLEERWTTVANFAASKQQLDSQTSKAMLQQVTSEAVAMGSLVKPGKVVQPKSVKPVLIAMNAALMILAAFMATNWGQTSVLMQRFWSPTVDITATQLVSETGDKTVPRGEALDIVTVMSGLQRESATMILDVEEFGAEEIELTPDEDNPGHFVSRIDVDDSFRYRVLSGDGRTAWHTITAIDYPELADVKLMVTPPDYVDREPLEKPLIPGRVRAIQGSQLSLLMKPEADLKTFELQLAFGGEEDGTTDTITLTPDGDGWYRYETQIVEDFSLTPMLVSQHDLQNEDRRVCNVHVITDKAPVARVIGSTEEMAVAATDVLDIEFEAHDDHGIATAELVVYDESGVEEGEEPKVLMVQEIPLGDQELQQHILGNTKLDLKELGLEEGANISYSVRVTDNRMVKLDPKEMKRQKEKETSASESLADQTQSPQSPSDGNDRDEPSSMVADNSDSKNSEKSKNSKSQDGSDSKSGSERDSNRDDSQNDSEMLADASQAKDAKNAQMQEEMLKQAEQSSADANEKTGENSSENQDNAKDKGDTEDSDGKTGETEASEKASDNKTGDQKRTDGDSGENISGDTQAENNKPGDTKTGNNQSGDRKSDNDDDRDNEAGKSREDNSEKRSKVAIVATPKDDDTDANNPNGDPDNKSDAETKSDPKNMPPKNSDGVTSDQDQQRPNGESTNDGKQATDNSQNQNANQSGNQTQKQKDANNKNSSSKQRPNGESKSKKDGDQKNDPESQPNNNPPPPVMANMRPQSSESGQKKETKRRPLKISERLAAVAAASAKKKAVDGEYRQKLIELDELLALVEVRLQNLLKRVNQDMTTTEQFRLMDEQLGDVEQVVSDFRLETRDTEFVFIGQQLLVIKRMHVTPARDLVFAAIKEPEAAANSFANDSLHHVMTAREQLQALIKKYERVQRDRKYKQKIDESVKIYEVYVEKAQRLMRAARRGSKDPFQRKMSAVEVDQAYLDRYAEVAMLRRNLMDEIAKLLSDDPRLLGKYMELIKRRRSSLWQQFTDLYDRQDEISQEVSGWVRVDDSQRENLWILFAELRLHNAADLVKEAVEVAERMESQLPLVLKASQGTPALAIRHAKRIALNARQCSLDAKTILKAGGDTSRVKDLSANAESLVFQLSELEAALDQLAFESGDQDGVAEYVDLRLAEARLLFDHADAWTESAAAIQQQAFHNLAHVDQQQATILTELLRVDMLEIETDLQPQFRDLEGGMPQEIANMTRDLMRLMEGITFNQQAAAYSLKHDEMPRAARQQSLALDKFEQAEKLFKKLRRETAKALDEIDPPDPNIADLRDPTLDQFLAELEREPNVEAQLGLPRRPTNLRRLQESMTWRQNASGGLGDSGEAAMARIRREMQSQAKGGNKPKPQEREMNEQEKKQQLAQAEQMKKMMQDAAKRMQEQADDPKLTEEQRQQMQEQAQKMQQMAKMMQGGQIPQDAWAQIAEAQETKAIMAALARGESVADTDWNRIMSTLDDGIAQTNRRTPPEDYRSAIEIYQDSIRQIAPLGANVP